MDHRGPGHARAILIRTAALGLALVGLFLLLRAMGEGVGTVAVGALVALVVLSGGAFAWSASDARRSSTTAPVCARWGAVIALLVGCYLAAAVLGPGSYGNDLPLVEVVTLALLPAAVLLALPAALGIARGSALRRRHDQEGSSARVTS